jgi:hypothetical protein
MCCRLVEISFDADLQKAAPPQQDDEHADAATPVHKGKAEFICHQEWIAMCVRQFRGGQIVDEQCETQINCFRQTFF